MLSVPLSRRGLTQVLGSINVVRTNSCRYYRWLVAWLRAREYVRGVGPRSLDSGALAPSRLLDENSLSSGNSIDSEQRALGVGGSDRYCPPSAS